MVLQTLRQRLTLALVALLPFHALLVTAGTKVISGPGNSPMTMLALWKEVVLGVILIVAVVEILRKRVFKLDTIDWLIIALLAISLLLFFYQLPPTTYHLLFGFKYDFIPLIAFLILRRVSWSEQFRYQVIDILIWLGGAISLYGIFTLFASDSFFLLLGYSDLHSLYTPDGPLAAYQQIGGSSLRRMQSTMSGPNQLGLWLLVPLGLILAKGVRGKVLSSLFLVLSLAILLTFSRSAWVAAAVMTGIALWKNLSRKQLLFIVHCSLFILVVALFAFPNIILRSASTSDHLRRPLQAVQTIIEHPFGLGLGTAGPASNRVSDTCVHLEAGADASWAADRPQLCVFAGDIQVQPQTPCHCPVLPENWYLQIGVEMGIVGFILFVTLTIVVLLRLRPTPYALFPFVGISIVALFLHAWEDAAVAYTVWLLVAASIRR